MATKPKPAAKKATKKPAKKPAEKPAEKTRKKPTLKQVKFVNEYLANGGNGVQAARAAGYRGNTNTLNQVARDNLQKPAIASRVRERLDGMAATSDEVLNLLGDHLRADLADFYGCFNEDGELDLMAAKRAGVSRLVKKIKSDTRTFITEDGTMVRNVRVELDLHDSQGAARILADLHGLKQQPKANEHNAQANREMADKTLQQLIADCEFNREQAVAFLRKNAPDVAKWLM